MRKKILALRQAEEIHLGVIETIILDLGLSFDYHDHYNPSPVDLTEYDYLIVLGGHMGAYQLEEYPQLHATLALIRAAHTRGIPTLGICLGAQLIAKAFGGEVFPNSQPELGWHPIKFTPSSHPLLSNLPNIDRVFQWHNDTFTLPPGAEIFASSNIAANQGFILGGNFLGLQFHPEINPEMLREWSRNSVSLAELQAAGLTAEQILNSCSKNYLDSQLNWVTALMNNFLGFSTP